MRPLRSPRLTRRVPVVLFTLVIISSLFLATLPTDSLRAQPSQDGPIVGQPWAGSMAVRETTAQIMARRELVSGPLEAPQRGETTLANSADPNAPASPRLINGVAVPDASPDPEAFIPSVATTWAGPTFLDSGFYPPDTMGAVGPTDFVVAINGSITSHNKNTGAIGALNASLNTFFNSVRLSRTAFDPRVRYDRFSQRWIVIAVNSSGSSPTANYILVAVSDGPTITNTTVWSFFSWRQDEPTTTGNSGCWADYPTMGVDNQAVYIGSNNFCPNTYGGSDAFVVRKSSILGAGPIVVTAFRNLGITTPHGVDNFDAGATTGYFIGQWSNSALGLRRITDPGGTPTISSTVTITTTSISASSTVPHFGNTGGASGQLASLTSRLMAAHIRNGNLVTNHTVGVNSSGAAQISGRAATRWYQIGNLDGTPNVIQQGTIFDPAASDPKNYWMATGMTNGQGHIVFGFSVAGNADYINAAVAGRLASDPLGTLGQITAFTNNTTLSYNPSYDTGASRGERRWGDYSYTDVDPCDDMTIWTIQQTVVSSGSGNMWGQQVAKLLAPPPAAIASVSPSIVRSGQSSINLTVTGTSTDGSGFFDPGAGFACRLAASFSGGVTVNSVTYTNPTQITINISTVGASNGAKTLTVTNPDGQTAQLASAITVGSKGPDTVGIYRPSNSTFYLRNSNTTGPADIFAVFGSGANDQPVAGDWNGDGVDTIGIYRTTTGQFFLKDANTSAAPVAYSFTLGNPGDLPMAGDWNNDGVDGVGTFRPTNGRLFLKNTLTTGFADFAMVLGVNGDRPVAGDWDGDGFASPGVYRPSNSRFYLTNQRCNCTVFADYEFQLGNVGDVGFAGDWDGNGTSGVGVFRPTNGITFLRNSLTTGFADVNMIYGIANDRPIAGAWQLQTTAPNEAAPEFGSGR